MRALLSILLTVFLAGSFGTAFAYDASTDIGDACQMQWIRDHRDGPGTVDAGYPFDVAGLGVEWQVSPPVGHTSGWWDIQIGDAWDTPSAGSGLLTCYGFPVTTGFGDWTAYTSFSLTFTNCSATDWFMADLAINTGWTDAPYSEPDNQYLAGWTWVAPGATVILSVDLTTAVNLNHVSNVSFKLGTNYGSTNNYDGTHICATVAPVDNVAPDPTGLCISTATPCVTVPVMLYQGSPANVRAASVNLQLSPELQLCGAGIQPGSLFAHLPWGSDPPYFYVFDHGAGSYTVDYSILGVPCGPTTGGQLFTLDVGASALAGIDDTGTITVTGVIVRNCTNAPIVSSPGPPALIPIDRSGPVAIGDLTATQVKAGNDGDGTTKIQLAFSVPADAAVVEVYRAPFGNYPEYDDLPGAGGVPATPGYPPAPPWALTGVVASGSTDEVAVRDFWYYVMFTQDACGNWSAVSNQTGGTLNYHLGDVSSPMGGPGFGENVVTGLDISLLGSKYGTGLVAGDLFNYLDVGPTTDYSVDALPTTDNMVQFEDLMMFAINYGTVSKPLPGMVADRNALTLRVPPTAAAGEVFEVVLGVVSDGSIRGLSVPLAWDAGRYEFVRFAPAEGLPSDLFVFSPEAGMVDAARFGGGLAGEMDLARVQFRALEPGAPVIAFGEPLVRDGANRPVVVGLELTSDRDFSFTPVETRLLPTAPNPFDGGTVVSFALAREGRVTVQLFAVDGRLVRTLHDEWTPVGEHQVAWNGRNDAGREVAAGSYLIRFSAPGRAETQRVIRLH